MELPDGTETFWGRVGFMLNKCRGARGELPGAFQLENLKDRPGMITETL